MNLVVLTHSQVQLNGTLSLASPKLLCPGDFTWNKEANSYVTGKNEGYIVLDFSKQK